MATNDAIDNPIRWFEELGIDDVPLVGGKNASLGEMYRTLTPEGIRVPNGFAVTADAYRGFLRAAGLDRRIVEILRGLDTNDVDDLRRRGQRARQSILGADLPEPLAEAIVAAYERLSEGAPGPVDVAVRSSATAEDLPDASFAGQQETYLNVQGAEQVLETCKRCFASLFTDRAISYRVDRGYSHVDVGLSVGVQRMVRSDLASSGVMFSIDTETGFRDAVLINASYGLGENVVQGAVNPDEYYVFKPTLKEGFRPILQKIVGSKEFKLIYDVGGGKMTRNVPVPPDDRVPVRHQRRRDPDPRPLGLPDRGALQRAAGPADPDGHGVGQGRADRRALHRPGRGRKRSSRRRRRTRSRPIELKSSGRAIVRGRSVGEQIGRGRACVIKDAHDLGRLRDGDVLVTDKTDPDWEPSMKKAAAIVTNRGGRTCHAAIVSRELGLPAVVGTERGTELIRDGQEVTVSCAEGDTGTVYEGLLDFEVRRTDLRPRRAAADEDHDERRQPRGGVPALVPAERRRRARP